MILKLLISSIILVGIIMLALSVKLLFDKNAEFSFHSCTLKEGEPVDEGVCTACKIRDIANCFDY